METKRHLPGSVRSKTRESAHANTKDKVNDVVNNYANAIRYRPGMGGITRRKERLQPHAVVSPSIKMDSRKSARRDTRGMGRNAIRAPVMQLPVQEDAETLDFGLGQTRTPVNDLR